MSHAKNFVHAWGNGVDRGGTTDFVVKFGGEFFAACDNLFAFFAVWVPCVFGFGAGFLTEGGEGNLGEAVFDDFVAFGKFVLFPVSEFASGFFDGFGDFLDLFWGEGVVVDLGPFVFGSIVAVILGALGYK